MGSLKRAQATTPATPNSYHFYILTSRRKTVLTGEGFAKTNEPITDDTFDNNSKNLGRQVGMDIPSYVYRRGNLQVMDGMAGPPLRDDAC